MLTDDEKAAIIFDHLQTAIVKIDINHRSLAHLRCLLESCIEEPSDTPQEDKIYRSIIDFIDHKTASRRGM